MNSLEPPFKNACRLLIEASDDQNDKRVDGRSSRNGLIGLFLSTRLELPGLQNKFIMIWIYET